jgi:putative transcriptional regulator
MPIRVNLDILLVRRGMTLSTLAERVGMSLPNLSILKTNKARAIRFSTLEAICRELDCQPGDLLVREDDRARRRSA